MSFNLIHEPWIPCMEDGKLTEYGLLHVLTNAHSIDEVIDNSPLVTFAIHRLMIAVLHHEFGPETDTAWEKLWKAGHFDTNRLTKYFDSRIDRFDLFGATPFMQTVEPPVADKLVTPIAKLSHARTSGANATLTNHSVDSNPNPVDPSVAARYLLEAQMFSVAGIHTSESGRAMCRATPLVDAALVLLSGSNLFESLLLNMVNVNRADEEPFPATPTDCPCWDRDPPQSASRLPTGYLDWLTMESRRIRLKRDDDGRVRWCYLMRGWEYPKNLDEKIHETAVTWRSRTSKKVVTWSFVRLDPDRALWRDSTALISRLSDDVQPSRVVEATARRVLAGMLDGATVKMNALGVRTKQAKIRGWRHEHWPLPTTYLKKPELLSDLRDAISVADAVAGALHKAMTKYASLLPQKPLTARVKARFGLMPRYWPRLDHAFAELLVEMPIDAERAIDKWLQELKNSASTAFSIVSDQASQPGEYRAAVQASGYLANLLRKSLTLEEQEGSSDAD